MSRTPDRRRFLKAAALGALLPPGVAAREEAPPPFRGHRLQVVGLAFAPDGRSLLSGSTDGTVRRWAAGGRPLGAWGGEHKEVLAVAFAPDGHSAATAGYGRTVVWDMPDGRCRRRFDEDFARRQEGRNPKIDGAC